MISSPELLTVLESLYVEARTKNGSKQYSCSSLLNAWSAIQRHLASVCHDIIDIINQPDFVMANKILDGALKQKKQSGDEAAVVHKQPISDDDWQQIME